MSNKLDNFGADALTKFIRKNELTQHQAASFFGVTRSRIADIMGGKLEKISIDYLTRMVNIAGGNVRYSVAMPRKRIKRAVRGANEKSANA